MNEGNASPKRSENGPRCAAVVGLQWGDEGKGKIVDLLTPGHAAAVRYNGGANAGHSVVFQGTRYALHLIPSGIFRQGVLAVIGNGVVVDPEALVTELDALTEQGVDASGLRLSSRAHVVLPKHKAEDAAREEALSGDGETERDRSIGTTLRGIGPAYADKVQRGTAIRVADLLRPDAMRRRLDLAARLATTAPKTDDAATVERLAALGERLRPFITDTFYLLHDLLEQGEPLLFEGANGTLLDVDHGTYPFVTSSNCSILGVGPGSGVSERNLGRVVGIAKAYCTRVGGGPFPTELHDDAGERIRERGREYGTTTGRPRRCGWLDLVALRYACMLNGCTEIALTLLDVLAGFDEILLCEAYEVDGGRTDRFIPDARGLAEAKPIYRAVDGFSEEITAASSESALPDNARRLIEVIERFVRTPVRLVSVGPDREQTIERR